MGERVGESFGNYQLLRLLGQGSFAEVYLGEHRYIDVARAVKILLHVDPKQHADFQQEARTIAHLQHPHIMRIYDFGIEHQTPYLVMDYMPNGTLRHAHPKGTRLSYERIIMYVKQIAAALDYAHDAGVIHRDIKPENILLNEKREALLSDFGLAIIQSSIDTVSPQDGAGTPSYMAPEQIERHACAASDQYALGVMVYEWLCGEAPFRGRIHEILFKHLYESPPSLCKRDPALSPAIENAVFGALAKDPQQRFSSVQDFAIALEEAFFATRSLPLPSIYSSAPAPQAILPPPLLPPVAQATLPAHEQKPPPQSPIHLATQSTTQNELAIRSATLPDAHINRLRLIRRVRAFWIEGVLERSLQDTALIPLGLQEHPGGVVSPWQLMRQQPDMTFHPLPPGTTIAQAYDTANETLLILGAPGAGKTTLLLELARELLNRAEHDPLHPVPVVFNLSSWTTKRQDLQTWMAEELSNKYQVPRKLGRSLVEQEQILPLLDGLDEVEARARTTCIHIINDYRKDHGLLPTVVCSRVADYLAQSERITLTSAVTIQPLTPAQVDSYVAGGGEDLQALRIALQRDSGMRELAETPLMLNILIQAYRGLPIKDLLWNGIAPTRKEVFERYIERMLTTRGARTPYQPEQIRRWLAHLAQQLKQRGQTVFYIERMQPDWLAGRRSRDLYDFVAVRLPGALMGVLIGLALSMILVAGDIPSLLELTLLGALLGWIFSEKSTLQAASLIEGGKAKKVSQSRLLHFTGPSLLFGLIAGASFWPAYDLWHVLFFALRFALCCLLLSLLLRRGSIVQGSSQAASERSRRNHSSRRIILLNGLLVAVLFGLVNGLSIDPSTGLIERLVTGLLFALSGGLMGSCLSALLIGRQGGVQPVDRLSWQGFGKSLFAKRHILASLQVSIPVGLLMGLVAGLASTGLASRITFGILFGLSAAFATTLGYLLLSGIFRGVESTTIEDQHRAIPNQGIHHSTRNSLLYTLFVTLLVGSGAGLLFKWDQGPMTVVTGLIIGLSVGLLAGLLRGGLTSWRHYLLRIILWRQGLIPWNFAHFLDTAVECILLRRVGGGYLFLHRLFLDHFDALGTKSIPYPQMAYSNDKLRSNVPPQTAERSTHKESIVAEPTLPLNPTQTDRLRIGPCGHRLLPNARFCSMCGAAVPP